MLILPEGEHFSCHGCTHCCRDWHVELSEAEAERLVELRWRDDDELAERYPIHRIGGRPHIVHRESGACLYLDETSGRCRIHETFGEAAKPLGCRLFPYHVRATPSGQRSVTCRFDCPTVRANEGTPLVEQRKAIVRLVDELPGGKAFDEALLGGLEAEAVEALSAFAADHLALFTSDAERALFPLCLAATLQAAGQSELESVSINSLTIAVRKSIEENLSYAEDATPSRSERLAFRALLGFMLRRDEDVIDKRASRVGRALSLASFALGRGNPSKLGARLPNARLSQIKPLQPGSTVMLADDADAAIIWRLMRLKLASMQFMVGRPLDWNFFTGLRWLSLIYPMTMVTARAFALAEDRDSATSEDISNAVGVIDHAWGRSPLLGTKLATMYAKTLLKPATMAAVVRAV